MAIQLDCLLLGDHFLDPDNMRMVAAYVFDLLPQLRGYLRSIGRPSAKHYLRLPRQVANCVNQMGYALLSSDTAYEQDIGHGHIDLIVDQRVVVRALLVFEKIDAVIDHVNAIRQHLRISTKDVRFGALRNSDDGVGIENSRPFHPETHGISAAELLSLPGAQGFE